MQRDTLITTTGKILEIMENGCYQAELPNGKCVLAFPAKDLAAKCSLPLEMGDLVRLELTPYDFSKARIVAPAK